jgi:hypothetical protein
MPGVYTYMYGNVFHDLRSLVTVIRKVQKTSRQIYHTSRDLKEKTKKHERAGREAYLGIPRKRANPQFMEKKTGELTRI